jgi:hypothetical protein
MTGISDRNLDTTDNGIESMMRSIARNGSTTCLAAAGAPHDGTHQYLSNDRVGVPIEASLTPGGTLLRSHFLLYLKAASSPIPARKHFGSALQRTGVR